MCGFLVHNLDKPIKPASSLFLRGPDEVGKTEICGFSMNSFRLSIVGKDYGVQPTNYSKSSLVYNGEIYNYVDIASRFKLSEKAHRSDTVCLHELINKISPTQAISVLEGHFAFVWIDEVSQRVVFARDSMGVKPLF